MPPANIYGDRRELLVNFDWQDIADLTGYINYNLWNSIDSAGITKHLIPSSIASGHTLDNAGDTVGIPSSSFTKIIDIDHDLTEFQLPRTIKGTALLKSAFQQTTSGTNPANTQTYIIMKLRKWNGDTSTETEIASVQSITKTSNSAGTLTTEVNLRMIVPLTLIKKGELLRLTVEGWGKKAGAITSTLMALLKPATGNSILTIPYRMNL